MPLHAVTKYRTADYWITLLLSMGSVLTLFCWQGHTGFNSGDEGFLWYGAQRVLLGEVPLRDFMAYDPGRYYWSASFMQLVGNNGIMTLRAAVALFQVLGLWMGLLAITRTMTQLTKANFLFLLLTTLTLVLWMFPRHKLFDISLSLFLITSLASLIELPTARRYFIAGICVGLIAVFGRNHGLYGAIGSLGVMIWLRIKPIESLTLTTGGAWWISGVILGFTPFF